MILKKILIATGNKGKAAEFEKYFRDYNIESVSLAGKNIAEPEENGKDFEENAYIKAKYYCNITKLPALADDSGLCIDQLDGKPGIYSARWAGEDKNFSLAIEKIEKSLKEKKVNFDNITGYFYCALALVLPNQEKFCCAGKITGKITFPARGKNGFGYDPIFIPDGENRSFAEMDFAEKQIYAHRRKALDKLTKYLDSVNRA